MGKVKEAEATFRAALGLVVKLDGPDHWQVLFAARGSLSRLYSKTGRLAEAETQCRGLVDATERAVAAYPKNRLYRHKLAFGLLWWADFLRDAGRPDDAQRAAGRAEAVLEKMTGLERAQVHVRLAQEQAAARRYRRAVEAYGRLLALQPDSAPGNNDLAWLLATCPDASLRNPARAVTLARKAVQKAPQEAGYWNTLGVAHYRADAWAPAIESLEKSVRLSDGGGPADWLFLAMARWQQGEKAKARQLYDRAVQRLDKTNSKDAELARFRAEAAALLGVPDGPVAREGKPPKK